MVAFICYDFRSYIGRRTTLLFDDIVALDNLAHTKVANLYSRLTIKEDVVELYVAVQDRAAVTVSQTKHYLFENELGVALREVGHSFDEVQQISAVSVLHDHQQVLLGLEYFKQANDIRVFDLLQNVDFLENFAPAEFILHVLLIDGLNSYVLASELMDTEGHFAKGTLA